MSDGSLHRREFLKLVAGGTAAAFLSRLGRHACLGENTPSPLNSGSNNYVSKKSLVVRTQSSRINGPVGLNRRVLREMITYGLNEMAGVASLSVACKEFFSKKDVIGFKFNSSQARLLGTNPPLADELLRMLVGQGYDPAQILFIEVQPNDDTLPKTAKVKFGWGPEISFGSGKDAFAAVLYKITAMVNVGLLKADPIAGMSGCLKNMSYGMIKHPARFFANSCTPYIADIYNHPIIRKKVRFNILNTLRILIRAEQTSSLDAFFDDNSLLFSKDVIAVDAIGYEMLDNLRKKKGLKPLIDEGDFPKQLIVGAEKGLGVYHPDQIQLKVIETGE